MQRMIFKQKHPFSTEQNVADGSVSGRFKASSYEKKLSSKSETRTRRAALFKNVGLLRFQSNQHIVRLIILKECLGAKVRHLTFRSNISKL